MSENSNVDFDWVVHRAKCCAFEVFKQIEDGVKMDVRDRVAQLPPPTTKTFKMRAPLNPSPDAFGVICLGQGINDAIDFTCGDDGKIVVVHGQRRIEATVSFNRDRQCVIVVNKEELENWQFRKFALEEFFRF